MENTLQCNIAISSRSELQCGPLVDDGALYSTICITDLQLLHNKSNYKDIYLDDNPSDLSKYDFWQYGSGSNSSDKRKILGCTVLFVNTSRDKAYLSDTCWSKVRLSGLLVELSVENVTCNTLNEMQFVFHKFLRPTKFKCMSTNFTVTFLLIIMI